MKKLLVRTSFSSFAKILLAGAIICGCSHDIFAKQNSKEKLVMETRMANSPSGCNADPQKVKPGDTCEAVLKRYFHGKKVNLATATPNVFASRR